MFVSEAAKHHYLEFCSLDSVVSVQINSGTKKHLSPKEILSVYNPIVGKPFKNTYYDF